MDMNLWRVVGKREDVVFVERNGKVMVLRMNEETPKVGDSVRVWENRFFSGKELKAQFVTTLDAELSRKLLNTPGLPDFLYEVSNGFKKEYIHFLRAVLRYVDPVKFQTLSKDKKKILIDYFSKLFANPVKLFERSFSFEDFVRFLSREYSLRTEKARNVTTWERDLDLSEVSRGRRYLFWEGRVYSADTGEEDLVQTRDFVLRESFLKASIALKLPIFRSDRLEVFSLERQLVSRGLLWKSYALIPFQEKTLVGIFKDFSFPPFFLNVKVAENPLPFLVALSENNAFVKKAMERWQIFWREKPVADLEVPFKTAEFLPRVDKLSLPHGAVLDPVFLMNELLQPEVRFFSFPSIGVPEMWWNKKSRRMIFAVSTARFGKVVVDLLYENDSVSLNFYVEHNVQDLMAHRRELEEDLLSLGFLVKALVFSKKDPMRMEGFSAYG